MGVELVLVLNNPIVVMLIVIVLEQHITVQMGAELALELWDQIVVGLEAIVREQHITALMAVELVLELDHQYMDRMEYAELLITNILVIFQIRNCVV
jgi:hypothetical protein